jgi:NAD(P)-dependent dehydrogenase (short-subunit alcohol dehydrogenase family)
MSDIFDISGRLAVVVGAAGGIGRAIAEGLAEAGAMTIWADKNENAIKEGARESNALGHLAQYRVIDVLDNIAIEELATEFEDAHILVVTPAILVRKTLSDQSEDDFDRQVALNLKSTFLITRAFGDKMAKRGRGSIVGFSSVRASLAEAGSGVYAMTKAGVEQLLRTLAAELGPQGVRVNMIAPSPVDTPLTADVRARADWYDQVTSRSMLRRWATPSDFVGPALLLASDASSFMTGAILAVDGGWTATDGLSRVPNSESG